MLFVKRGWTGKPWKNDYCFNRFNSNTRFIIYWICCLVRSNRIYEGEMVVTMANDKSVEIAKKYVGITEYPPNSNNVQFNQRFYGKEVSGSAYPWCCAFVWCVHDEAGVPIKKTASCAELGSWFKNNGKFKTTGPNVGDIVFFKFQGSTRWTNHVGIVVGVGDGYIKTIEGNTSSDDKGSQSNGGMVAERKRKLNNTIVGYGYFEPIENTSPTIYPTLKVGSRGASVKTLQTLLNSKGAHLSVDGCFGQLTKIAVLSFQGANGLKKDGIVGKLTWAKLLNK